MSRKKSILVVDDQLESATAIEKYLRLRGFHVSIAGDKDQIDAAIKIEQIDLVVLGLSMAGTDTIELIRKLKSSNAVGVIIVAKDDRSGDRVLALESGADDCILKPLNFRELLARINTVLQHTTVKHDDTSSNAAENRVRLGDLIFERREQILIDGGGNEVNLTSGELDLLNLLVENANRPVSRTELMEKSSHRDWGPLDRGIDVKVARLRRKVESDPAKPRIIKTVRGVGYMLSHSSGPTTTPVLLTSVNAGLGKESNPALPERHSIAVLPFTNMSEDVNQEYFSDGITEDIITELSRYTELNVIARHTSFAYKSARIQDLATTLGVRYVLEGSIRIVGNRVRITAQLIDALTESHVWAERYDREFDDAFGIQDEITRKIVVALQVKLTTGEVVKEWAQGTHDSEAWECMVSGREQYFRFTAEDNVIARGLFERALELDPDFLMARVFLGWTHWSDAHFHQSADPHLSLATAERQIAEVRATDKGKNMGGTLVASIHYQKREFDEAVLAARSAMAFSPGPGDRAQLGHILVFAGESAAAITELKMAIRLSPYHPNWYLMALAKAHIWNGDKLRAVETGERYLKKSSKGPLDYANLAMIYALAGRAKDAERMVNDLKSEYPSFRIGEYERVEIYKNRQQTNQMLKCLRDAGLPE